MIIKTVEKLVFFLLVDFGLIIDIFLIVGKLPMYLLNRIFIKFFQKMSFDWYYNPCRIQLVLQ